VEILYKHTSTYGAILPQTQKSNIGIN